MLLNVSYLKVICCTELTAELNMVRSCKEGSMDDSCYRLNFDPGKKN